MRIHASRTALLLLVAVLAVPALASAQLQVVSTTPARNATAGVGTSVSIEFDRALDTSTVNVDTFRVFGRWSGPKRGTYTFSNGNRTATLVPDTPFSAGEIVFVNLSHDLRGADTSALRAAGYAVQFMTGVTPTTGTFQQIQHFSNRTGAQTRIYGASATDLNGDGFLDLATINEVSADVRVFLNAADGSGTFGSMLTPAPIGVESSPNEPADFDNDGRADLCVAAASSGTVAILLGAGDGSFASTQNVDVGDQPHGIAPLDVDGDGDLDIVNCNYSSNNLSLMLNDGSGTFGAPTFFDGGVNGEYGLSAADMDGDGITDLVVAGQNDGELITMLGNGDGTFTAAGTAQSTGGNTWVIAIGDLDGDGEIDATTANDGTGNVGVLLGQGDGTFGPVSTISIGAHVPGVDLGDLDGDGDLDLVVSSFGGGFWRWFRNDGSGGFTFEEEFDADSNPSCAVLLDADADGDLDMALTDEIADTVTIMENTGGGASSACSPAPSACRTPVVAGKAKLSMKDAPVDTADNLVWKWSNGMATTKAEFGNPLASDDYDLCLYEDGALVQGFRVPAGGICNGKACWKETATGFVYADKAATPDGATSLKLGQGLVDGKAKLSFKGKGTLLPLPDLSQLTGTLDVQLQKAGGPCWGATYTPPFVKNAGGILKAVSDAPTPTTTTTTTTSTTTTTTLPPLWSAIHTAVIGPTCGGCHGGSGGLAGLASCNTAHANLVNVPSVHLPTMDRVEPGNPATSFLMHKLDGTQGMFNAMCGGGFCGSQMPLGGSLPLATRDAIRTWITNGAVNDCP